MFTGPDAPDKADNSLLGVAALKTCVMQNCCTPEPVWGPPLAVCVTASGRERISEGLYFNQLVENVDVQKPQIVSFFNVRGN